MVVVVFKKYKTSKKSYMHVFMNEHIPDRIINLNARKPLVPNNYVIEEIGIGTSFIESWKQKYKIKTHQIVK